MKKPKTNQIKLPNEVQGRDLFSTPRYATELLIPFIPEDIKCIWECAAGDHFIKNVLEEYNYKVMKSDIRGIGNININFVEDKVIGFAYHAIVTNPPFSLKKEFFYRCVELNKPFALLLPFDVSRFLILAFRDYNCQGLVPTRRINYISPTGKSGRDPSAQFHSFWLCRYFNLPKQLTFVELSIEDKKRI